MIHHHDYPRKAGVRDGKAKAWKIQGDELKRPVPLVRLRVERLLSHPTLKFWDPRLTATWDGYLSIILGWRP